LLPPPPLSYPTVARTSRPSKRRETPITATALPSCRRWCCNAAAPKRQGTPATALSPRRCQPQSTLKTPLPVPCTWRPKGGRRGGAALVERPMRGGRGGAAFCAFRRKKSEFL
jgi:hypothetical protein